MEMFRENEINGENDIKRRIDITYGIDDCPPWYLCFFLAIQHYFTMIGAIVSIPFILTPALCMEDENPDRGFIISTMVFVTGIVTYFQVTWGCRLPIVNVNVPILNYRKCSGLGIKYVSLFKLFSVLLTIIIMWAICGILTYTNVFNEGHPARTDIRLRVLTDAPWFRIPYPGQFGLPTVTIASVFGMLAGVLACTVESISYYPTVSQMCNAPPPPLHAINRGIAIEGIGTMMAGLWGSGNGTNTFGENVGAIGVTKVGSRRVIQWAAGIMIVQGVLSKFGAAFIMIPDPVVGGIFCVMFGMITAFGLSALQYINLRSSRNLYIIGLSLFVPLVLFQWLHKNQGAINTGVDLLDGVLSVLLGTSILVGGFLGCLLDHIIPGTREERGIISWEKEISFDNGIALQDNSIISTYDFPWGMKFLKKWKWTTSIPFLPTYKLSEKTT